MSSVCCRIGEHKSPASVAQPTLTVFHTRSNKLDGPPLLAHRILFGYIAFLQDAEVFRTAKAPQSKASVAGVKRTRGVAFGTGAADEDDTYGMMEDYVNSEADPRKGMLFEIAGDSDEEDLPYVMGRYTSLFA